MKNSSFWNQHSCCHQWQLFLWVGKILNDGLGILCYQQGMDESILTMDRAAGKSPITARLSNAHNICCIFACILSITRSYSSIYVCIVNFEWQVIYCQRKRRIERLTLPRYQKYERRHYDRSVVSKLFEGQELKHKKTFTWAHCRHLPRENYGLSSNVSNQSKQWTRCLSMLLHIMCGNDEQCWGDTYLQHPYRHWFSHSCWVQSKYSL